ncbi:AMP-binding protein, partial [Streptomyces brasiliscabiei]|uniref:AMP-binding protein n=1 Tax=Streptomyces brasiliscabiei TaxID=2736302 RepID=UPI0030144BA9
FSGAMALSGPLRRRIEERFACPVVDVYGLHETRPIAARVDDGPFRVLDRRVRVEILDDAGRPVPDGEIGEIVVTAGENPLLPLVRYRT